MKKIIHTNNTRQNLWGGAGGSLLIGLCCFLLIIPVGCEKENGYTGDPYFTIEGDPTGISTSASALTQAYTVRSNRPWKVMAKDDAEWARAYPDEGDLDGIFRIILNANREIAPRTANFAFVVNGEEMPVLFRVDQEASGPFVALSPTPVVAVLSTGGSFTVTVDANVEWDYTLSDATWLTQLEKTPGSLTFNARENMNGGLRETTLWITPVLPEYADAASSVTIRQSGLRADDGEAVGYKYFEDNFDWVIPFGGPRDVEEYNETGDAVVTGTFNMYTKLVDGYAVGDLARAFDAHGYTDANPSPQIIYFASHYLKFGKTDYQSGIQRTIPIDPGKSSNVTLTFDATPCITGSKNFDSVLLLVEIDGPGTVDVDDETTKQSAELDIRLVNQSAVWDWKSKSVVLYGITSDSKITIKTNKSGSDSGTFRFYLDNLKFEKHSVVTP
jgi:hypothetical protein